MSAESPPQRPAAAWPWLIPVVRAWGGFAGWLAAKPISLVLALAVTHGLLYAVIVPPWQAPDETTHYEYLRALSTSPEWLPLQMARPDSVFQEVMTSARKFRWWEHRKRPTPAESPALSEEWNLTFRAGYLYYRLSQPLYSAVAHWPIEAQLTVLRFYSVALQGATVWLTYRMTGLIFTDRTNPVERALPLVAAMVVALQPQYTFISASYNDDNLVPVWVAAMLYAMLKGLRQNGDGRWLGLAVLAAALAVLTKRTGFSAALLLGPAMVAYGFVWQRSRSVTSRWLGRGVVLAALALGAVSVTLVVSPSQLPDSLIQVLRVDSNALIRLASYWQEPARLLAVDWVRELVFLSVSFWGSFGYFLVPLDVSVMEILRRVTLFMMIGCGIAWIHTWLTQRSTPEGGFRLVALLLLALGLGLSGFLVLVQFLVGPPVYLLVGRYLFPFISAFGILAAWGWAAWWPRPWKVAGLLAGLVLLGVLDFIALALTILPYFYS